ncbi:haloacid dehalogenase-like hydrolase domain-containing protein 2 [Wyeomyia smithii]|uniref:haloacid dehalogenase-like hydrolase domain-containing protein 2 n=1 Tax=Wyeomyia smithii TaxID=174621 RepID=UPI002467DF15|nr:haloacid dehalogenase-like hydrolase domain-containing protein 2 [Wyeomyia smithii]
MLRTITNKANLGNILELKAIHAIKSAKGRKYTGNCATVEMPKIRAALIDLSGTLHIDDQPTEGAVDALEKLRSLGITVKFVTNTTKESVSSLYTRLVKIGFQLEQKEICSSLIAASNYVKTNGLNPYYIVTDDARRDFPPHNSAREYDSVVIGLAPERFTYDFVNEAFRILHQSKGTACLIAIHEGKYYKTKQGISIGPGCFVKGLEYSTGIKSTCVGKPNKYFFWSALPEGFKPDECVMIGDDPNDDCLGAMAIGMQGFLVETGKYQPELYTKDSLPQVSGIFKDFRSVVEHIANNCT